MDLKTIRELRQEKGWTQLQLANKLGVTPVTVYNWERGKSEPRMAQLRAMTALLGVCVACNCSAISGYSGTSPVD